MDIAHRVQYKEKFTLITGDLVVVTISLWLTTVLRNFSFVGYQDFVTAISPFTYIVPIWFLLFFISGIYDRQTLATKQKIPKTVITIQSVNVISTVLYFYLFSTYIQVSATPKTILVIYGIVSTALLLFWRLYVYRYIAQGKRVDALIIASGKDLQDLVDEVEGNSRYPFTCKKVLDLDTTLDFDISLVDAYKTVIIDIHDGRIADKIPLLYHSLFLTQSKNFIDFVELYEDVFQRVPLASLQHGWFLDHVSMTEKKTYDTVKRVMDVILCIVLAIPFLIVYPFVVFAIKLEDKGEPFILQERVGERGQTIYVKKFRTMTGNQNGVWLGEKSELRITRVGAFLRKSRIDELPQILSILKGESSLIGPRADLTGMRDRLIGNIPYYEARYTVKPGLSGWAQVTQDGLPPQSVDETKLRLSYDFYYIKHRSIWLDVLIALKTVKTLSMRVGV